MNPLERWSLVVLWWGTALVSALGWGGISHALVRASGWVPEALVSPLVAGGIGYGLGVGLASLFGRLVRGSELAFRMMPQILVISASAVLVICMLSALLSIRKVIQLEPAIVFKS